MSGVIMYPQQMKQKTKHMQRQLEKLDLNAANGYQLLGRAGENRLFLMGIAWDSVRSYMSEVQMPLMKTFRLWIEEHKNATAAYEQAVNRLPKVLCLDQDKLEWELEDYIRRLDREYDREHPSSYRIARYRNMIREIRGKLRDMQDFLNATKGLYTEALRLQEILGRADTELKGISSDPETGAVSFSSVNNSWLLEMQNAIGEKYLKDLGISDREIERMKKLGLEAYELKARHECLETEEDRAFFADIINERYLKAFQVNPDKLSLEAKFFLTEYTRMLADKGNIKELEQLINDMLYTDAYHSRYPTGQALDAYGYEYVSILFDITSCLLEEEGKALYAGKNIFTDTGRKKFGSSLKKLADLNALWGAVQRTSYESKYFYESGIESISMRLMYGSKIQNLEHEGSGFEFDTIYSTAWIGDSSYYAAGNNVRGIEWHEGRVLRVSTSVNTSLSSIDSQTYKETIQDLREKKETLWMKYMINTGTGIMGIMCPEAGLVYGLISGAADGNASKVGEKSFGLLEKSGVINKEIMDSYKIGGKSAVNASAGLIDYMNELKSLEKQIEEEGALQRMKWFGATSSFDAGNLEKMEADEEDSEKNAYTPLTETVNAGYYNGDALTELRKWEEQGLESIVSKELEAWEKQEILLKDLKARLETEKKYSEAVKILFEGGEIMEMDINQFVRAVESIEEAYEKLYPDLEEKKPCGNKLNIQNLFQNQ